MEQEAWSLLRGFDARRYSLPPDTQRRILCYLAGAPLTDRRLLIRHLRSERQQTNANSGQRRSEAGTKDPDGKQ